MTGAHDLRILQIVGLVAGILLWSSASLMRVLPPSAAEPMVTPTTERGFPYRVIAMGHGATAVTGSELVWLVHGSTATDEQRIVTWTPSRAVDSSGPACIADGDGDRCSDVTEVQAGVAPFDATDCVGSASGQPAINYLFPMENLACNGDPIAVPEEPESTVERVIGLRLFALSRRRNP